ncbi:MAG: serine/threonine protein kinase, partial [Archangium sp.]|nr:serine/threonine protein kinase [Archangium sp.]
MRDAVLEAEAKALVGQVLDGRYRLESVLGHGGMGLVFRAMQTSMDRPVAVKTLHPQLAMAPLFFERFKREAEVASRLHHPNIITIFDFGRTTDNHCYYVMELLEGESLRQRIKRDGPMSVRQATAIIEQVAIGVAHAHKQGVIHRDIKPHNVMITAVDGAEYVKVLDFGLVKAMEADDDEQLTSTGQVLGTPQYMPPEQAGGEDVDQRSDLYSLAGVLYYCLTGHSPYGANTVRKALQAALTKKPNPVAEHRHGAPIPEALERLLVKGLSSEKADRYQTAEAFIEALHTTLASTPDAELDAVPKRTDEGSSKDVGSGSSSAHHREGSRARAKSVAVAKPLPKSGQSLHRDPEPKPPLLSSAGFLLSVAAALVAVIVGALWWKYEKTSEREAAQQVAIA